MDEHDAERTAAGKTDEELVEMLRHPQDWQPLVLDAARLELQKRNLPVPDSPMVTPNETTSIWSFQGRIPRSGFWGISLSLTVFNLAVVILVEVFVRYGIRSAGQLIEVAFVAIALWISLAVQVKRWHDLNRSGWMVLFNLTVIALPAILIFLGCIRGSAGPNRFGADLLQQRRGVELAGG